MIAVYNIKDAEFRVFLTRCVGRNFRLLRVLGMVKAG